MTALEKPRILLVDDHAAVRHGLALVLTEKGVGECREAAGPNEALAAVAWPMTPCNWLRSCAR